MQASQKERNVLQSRALKPSVTQQSCSPDVFFLVDSQVIIGFKKVSNQQVWLQIGMIAVTHSTLASKLGRIWMARDGKRCLYSWKDMRLCALELHEAQTEFEHSTDLVLNLMNSMKCPCHL